MQGAKYILRYFFEWGGGCLWPGNEAAFLEFELGPYDLCEPCPLPLSSETVVRCQQMAEWHDASLNWDYPPNPGPWRQVECDKFNRAAGELLSVIRADLGPDFQVIDEQRQIVEDPELDEYLASPKGFRRIQQQ